MTPREELVARWESRTSEWKRLAVQVDGAKLLSELLLELETLFRNEDAAELTLSDAARISGYSTDHLSRLLRTGHIANVGRPGRPRIRVGDLPRKPVALQHFAPDDMLARRQIALSVVTSDNENDDG